MGRFPTFKLTPKQIKGIANIIRHEQGTLAGRYAEASQIANIAEIKYGGDPVKAVCSGWYAYGKSRFNAGTTNEQCIRIVKRVLCEGFRTLPRYVDEHDCMSDIDSVIQNEKNIKWSKAKWVPHKAYIRNKMHSCYWFYGFPGGYKSGVDPFGYTKNYLRDKYGDFCYTVKEAEAGTRKLEEMMPVLKRGTKGTAVKIWQIIVGMPANGSFGEKTEAATKKFQKDHNLKDDGVVGFYTWAAGMGTVTAK